MTQNHSSRAQLQAQIKDTADVMPENIKKVINRGESLDSLQDKTFTLRDTAQLFHHSANRSAKKCGGKR